MATNFATATYTEVVDMQTVDGKLSVIGIHTPVGRSPYSKLKGFFTQFKKYKYDGISSMTICPAAGLPIDPLGLSSVPGSTEQMDPRDTFNPILFKGCHGEHLHQVLSTLYNEGEFVKGNDGDVPLPTAGGYPAIQGDSSADKAFSLRKNEFTFGPGAVPDIEAAYYSWLTDTSWRKFGIQSVVKLRNLHPLVWRMARNMPMLPSASGDVFQVNGGEIRRVSPATATTVITSSTNPPSPSGSIPTVPGQLNGSNSYVQEFTNGVSRLGWLPTTVYTQGDQRPYIAALPKLFMGVLVLPPSYSVEQFMRAVIVHHFSFKDFTTSTGAMDPNVIVPATGGDASGNTNPSDVPYANWIDYNTSKGASLDVFNGSTEVISDGVA